MAKRPDTKETVLFAIELLRRIPPKGSVTATELHQQLSNAGFERELRTVQRQLEMLSEHFEIERDDRTKPYGYRWKEKSRGLALSALSEQESLMLMLAEQQLRGLLPSSLIKSMEAFFEQARKNLDPYRGDKGKLEREWLKKVRVVSTTQPLLPPKVDPEVFEQVSSALYANRWLTVDYQNAAGKRTQADVMPLGLAQQGPRLFLVCRFRDYDDERSLALHRIRSAKASTLTFDRPKDFDLEQFDNEGGLSFGTGKRIRLMFRITREAGFHLLETRLSEDQQAKELADGYDITATVADTAMLDWWLRGFGDAVWDITKMKLRGVEE